MKLKSKRRPRVNKQPVNDTVVALVAIGHHVLCAGGLESPESREELRVIFRQALASVPDLVHTREFAIAMQQIGAVDFAIEAEKESR
jgi:hypothetical protein